MQIIKELKPYKKITNKEINELLNWHHISYQEIISLSQDELLDKFNNLINCLKENNNEEKNIGIR